MNDETWKPIKDYPGYEVSNLGKIRSYYIGNKRGISTQPQRILADKPTKLGYPLVKLYKKGQDKKLTYVHKIVAQEFLGDRPKGLEICHKDDNRLNNKVSNLYYGTSSQNKYDAVRNNKLAQGETHCNAKVKTKDVIYIRECYSLGNITQDKLAELYNVSRRAIGHIVLGSTWKHIGGPIRGVDYV